MLNEPVFCYEIRLVVKMSKASDRVDVSETPPPPNWILQHPAVSVTGALCCIHGSGDESCSNQSFFSSLCQYREMKNLEVGDSAQVHAAFLVYMDLAEGEFLKTLQEPLCSLCVPFNLDVCVRDRGSFNKKVC